MKTDHSNNSDHLNQTDNANNPEGSDDINKMNNIADSADGSDDGERDTYITIGRPDGSRNNANMAIGDSHDYGNDENITIGDSHDYSNDENITIGDSHDYGNDENITIDDSHDYGNDENITIGDSHDYGNDENITIGDSHNYGNDENITIDDSHDYGNDENITIGGLDGDEQNIPIVNSANEAEQSDSDSTKNSLGFFSSIKSRLTANRLSLIAGGVLAVLLVFTVVAFRDSFFTAETEYNSLIFGLCLAGALLIGIFTAFRIQFTKRGQKVYSTIFYLLMPVFALFMTECVQGVFIYNFSPRSTIANYILFVILYAVFTVFTGKLRPSILIATPILFILSIAADFILTSRGTPVMPADLATIGTGLDVAAGYSISVKMDYIAGFLTLLAIEILTFKMPTQKNSLRSGLIKRGVSLILIACTLIPFYTTDVAANNGLKPDFWDQERGYNKSGTFLNFFLNTKYLIIEKPENYNADEIPSIISASLEANQDDEGILASSLAAQELERQRLEEEALIAAQQTAEEQALLNADNAEDGTGTDGTVNTDAADGTGADGTVNTDAADGTGADGTDPAQPEAEQKLPNTGLDTPLAVQGTSTISQPRSFAKLKKGQTPNIIAIMNETYADLRALGQFETNMDYMPFTRSLTKNTIKGNLYMPVNGAGTSNSEFEFLTGNSMAFLTGGSNAYELYVKNTLPSLAHALKALNYSRSALHVYYRSSWQRDVNYPLLGFEEFISVEDVLGEDIVNDYRDNEIDFYEYEDAVEERFPGEKVLLRRFVSDSYDYKVLLDMYENRDKSKPFFIFNVTMQNHGGYDVAYANFQQQVKITSTDEFYPKTNRFLSLMYESDQAFADLVEYFSNTSEPTVILMFGDHQPSIENEFIESLLGNKLTDLTTEQKQKRYMTPFIIWANYDIYEGYIDKISSNYLSTLLLQTAGIETTVYNDYLSAVYRQIPVINTTGYITADGTHYTYDEETEYSKLLSEYEKVQYNNLFDNLERHTELFYLNEEQTE